MEKYFKIGEVAETKGFSIQVLRYFDKIGLVKPQYVDPDTNYRYYSNTQFYKLEIIKYLKSLDVSNEELLNLCKNNDIDEWDTFFEELSKRARHKIDTLYRSIAQIDNMRNRIRYLKNANEHEGIYYQYFDARYVIEMDCHTLPVEDETIRGFTSLYKDVAKHSLNNLFQSGAILTYDDSLKKLNYKKIYVEVSNCPEFDQVPNRRVIPAGLYICINNCIQDTEQKAEILLDYLRKSGISPNLIVEEYIYTDFIEYNNPHLALQILES